MGVPMVTNDFTYAGILGRIIFHLFIVDDLSETKIRDLQNSYIFEFIPSELIRIFYVLISL